MSFIERWNKSGKYIMLLYNINCLYYYDETNNRIN